jgi:hypothetical protein
MNHLDAFYQTVHAAPGGCESVAPRIGMSAQVLRNKANPNSATNKPTLDDADRLMAITADYRILEALAANHGFTLTKLGEEPASDMAVLEQVTNIWQRLGDVASEVHKTLADGKVENHEVEAVRRVVMKAVPPLFQLVECLNGMAEK